jgi:hypothetical protein
VHNLTETRYRELLPGFSKLVIIVKTLLVNADEDERIFTVMSGLLKPASRLTEWLSETQFTVHSGLLKKPASVLTEKSVSQSKDSGTAFSRAAQLVSVYIEAV